MTTNTIATKKYIGITLSPLRIGSGNRIRGVADLSVARDVDNLPVIPSTTIKGCARAYSFLDFSHEDCDGDGQQCPQPHICPSCAVFGYLSYRQNQGSTSLVRFSYGLLLFTPVQTKSGLIWLTSSKRLTESGIISSVKEQKVLAASIKSLNNIAVASSLFETLRDNDFLIGSLKIVAGSSIPIDTKKWLGPKDVRSIYERSIILPEEHIGAIANEALTVSTSIVIDKKTGSAKSGGLYSFEAVPRSSVFTFKVGYINPEIMGIERFVNGKSVTPSELPGNYHSLIQIVENGLAKFEVMGIGGKRSQGFGSLKVWPIPSQNFKVAANKNRSPKSKLPPAQQPVVFISHSSKDKRFVRKLAADLQRRRIRPWLDEREILVGDSLHRRISDGIEKANYLILVLSEASIKSGWVEREVNAGLMRELENKNVIVLPILKEQLDHDQIPILIRERRYASFVEDYEEGLHDLTRSIKAHKERGK